MKNLFICSLVCFCCSVSGEVFSAVSELEGLIGTEARLLEIMESFIEKIQGRVDSLKRELLTYKKENLLAMENLERIVTNPISAYLLIKRVVLDLKIFEQKMFFDEVSKDALFHLEEIQKTMPYATNEDLAGTTSSLLRLQDTYHLDTSSLARGNINGVQSLGHLTAKDCYNIAVLSFTKGDFYHTILWMKETIALLEGRLFSSDGVKRWEALEFLAYSYYQEGDLNEALTTTEELLRIYPTHKGAKTNRNLYIELLKNITSDGYKANSGSVMTESDLYKMACRNEVSPSSNTTSELGCQYLRHHNPFLRLAPIKEEIVHNNPKIILYKNVLTEEEMKLLIDLSKKKLQRAGVENASTGESETSDVRLSKFSWLIPSDGEWVKKIFRRVEDITSLTTESAEPLQVVNYGIGGHYNVHEDYATVESSKITSLGTGNRIATILFYLSDVPQGGATVFPHIHLPIQPEKGTALFWWNLFPDGQGDPLTRHAACPVLIGSKWVATVWLHEGGQEFRRPCELSPNNPTVLFH